VRGTLRLLLLLGFAAVGLFFLGGMPRNVSLVYDLDDAAGVRALEAEVRRTDAVLRHAEYRFPDGAPRQVLHEVKLPDGSYEVLVRVSRASGPVQRSLHSIVVSESGPVVLAIRGPASRAD
jgi:hypothetical protein